jgi:diguanylate cyclase (GGDEF)-like protein
VNTHDDANLQPSVAHEPSLDELLAEVLHLVDETVETRLADGELLRRRERIKTDVDLSASMPPAAGVLYKLRKVLSSAAGRPSRPRSPLTGLPAAAPTSEAWRDANNIDRAALREAEEIREAARRDAEAYQEAAIQRATVAVTAARREAEQILAAARRKADAIVANAETERQEAVASAGRSYYDSLTGLANRTMFHERVQQAVDRIRATFKPVHPGRDVVGVLLVDLDDFKIVNNTLGHEIGDELLAAVGRRIAGAMRPGDMVARLGGDEFAALVEDANYPHEIEQAAERILTALAKPFRLGRSTISVVASIGVATTVDAADAQDLLRQADLALYVAKGAGNGQWRRYQATLHTAIRERLELRSELGQAVANGAFVLQYQPIVDLASGVPVGLEALIRWNHPTRGTIPPGQFIEIAEESGLIAPIGTWVLDEAISTFAGWSDSVPAGTRPYVSVNVSTGQFRMPSFVEMVRAKLRASGFPPECLVIEITESLLLCDDQVWIDLAALRDLGVRVAIDDFGTGYSSLSYLRQIPVDILKIDRSFIDGMGESVQQRALVEGIVRFAHTLGLATIAEGIEDPRDRDLLSKMGCPFGQGFLFSKPVDEFDAIQWLAAKAAV